MAQQFYSRTALQSAWNCMAQLIGHMSYGLGLTLDDYTTRYSRFAARQGRARHHVNSQRNNARKALISPKPTYKALYGFIDILNFDLVSITIRVRNRETNEEFVFASNDPIPELPGQAKPVPPEAAKKK